MIWSWYNSGVKRKLFSLFLISATFWIGCNRERDLTIDMSKVVVDTNAPPVNLAAEITRAKTENKLLLLEFGSSDSCPPCIAFEQKVFSTPEFQAYEKSNLVFVRINDLLNHEMRRDTAGTNILLERQFDIVPYPTFIALNHDGKEFWRTPGKDDLNSGTDVQLFNPKNFIALLVSVKQKEK
jgi:thioredoxin-related protein